MTSRKSTRIVITDPAAGGFGFGLCQAAGVRDLVVDYDPVPCCQGTIRAVDEARSVKKQILINFIRG